MNQYYEVTGSQITTNYYLGGKQVAVRKGITLSYLHQDSLGSSSLTSNTNGSATSRISYFPFGMTRSSTGTLPTDKLFTGQRKVSANDPMDGLYYYGARYYDAGIGRFISADTIVPDPMNPQALNRYSYCRNNPLKYVDPSGNADGDPTPGYIMVGGVIIYVGGSNPPAKSSPSSKQSVSPVVKTGITVVCGHIQFASITGTGDRKVDLGLSILSLFGAFTGDGPLVTNNGSIEVDYYATSTLYSDGGTSTSMALLSDSDVNYTVKLAYIENGVLHELYIKPTDESQGSFIGPPSKNHYVTNYTVGSLQIPYAGNSSVQNMSISIIPYVSGDDDDPSGGTTYCVPNFYQITLKRIITISPR